LRLWLTNTEGKRLVTFRTFSLFTCLTPPIGLGLYLQALAASMPERLDIHEPWRTIQSLNPYEHLLRCFRICQLHNYRNIKGCAVSDQVRWLMRSLICLEHDDWDGTIQAIKEQGGKAGSGAYKLKAVLNSSDPLIPDWVRDKETSKFAFPAMCWEKSFIPLLIWRAGDNTSNVIEQAHEDANREGLRCSLVGGLEKGRALDELKMKTVEVHFAIILQLGLYLDLTLQALEKYGVRPTYKSGHVSSNAYFNLKRKGEPIGYALL
jgi:hypothetical protein